MTIKVWVIDKKSEKYKNIILKKARLVASFLSLDGHLEIFLVGDKQMKKNVLSYVQGKKDSFPRPDLKEKYLGEIHLNISHIQKDKDDFLFMLFHGILHIAGYDHKQKNDKMRMERKEKIIFSKFGL